MIKMCDNGFICFERIRMSINFHNNPKWLILQQWKIIVLRVIENIWLIKISERFIEEKAIVFRGGPSSNLTY